MESFISMLYAVMPVLHMLLIAGLIAKIILMLGFRNFDFPYLISSYFRFYDKDEASNVSNHKRKLYVTVNNYINYYTYLWLLLTVICILVYGSIK